MPWLEIHETMETNAGDITACWPEVLTCLIVAHVSHESDNGLPVA